MNIERRVLYNYFRSSSSYRVRIALRLKGLSSRYVAVHLNRGGGEQFLPEFAGLNPQHLVPVLDDGGVLISQSIAIMEYLDEAYPGAPLLPSAVAERAWVRQLALVAACEIHPLNNLRVLKYLTGPMGVAERDKQSWIAHWTALGLETLETMLAGAKRRGRYCHGDSPGMADCCLVPQLFNATRFGIDLSPYPTLLAIDTACQELSAFQLAHPGLQPDSE